MRWDLTVRSRLTAAVLMAVPLPRGPGTRAAHKKTASALGMAVVWMGWHRLKDSDRLGVLSTRLCSTHHPLLHPLAMCAPCLVMRAPVKPGWSGSAIILPLPSVPSSGTEAARAIPTTLCPWRHANESVEVWKGCLYPQLQEKLQGERHSGTFWEQGHNHICHWYLQKCPVMLPLWRKSSDFGTQMQPIVYTPNKEKKEKKN